MARQIRLTIEIVSKSVQEKNGIGNRVQNIKMEISHLSRSVWQLEPPFDNVMHKIMQACSME